MKAMPFFFRTVGAGALALAALAAAAQGRPPTTDSSARTRARCARRPSSSRPSEQRATAAEQPAAGRPAVQRHAAPAAVARRRRHGAGGGGAADLAAAAAARAGEEPAARPLGVARQRPAQGGARRLARDGPSRQRAARRHHRRDVRFDARPRHDRVPSRGAGRDRPRRQRAADVPRRIPRRRLARRRPAAGRDDVHAHDHRLRRRGPRDRRRGGLRPGARGGGSAAKAAVASTAAAAVDTGATPQWKLLGTSAGNGGIDVYVAPASIRRSGDKARMHNLFDFKSAPAFEGKPFLSARNEYEFDCARSRQRMLGTTGFSGHMGKGTIVASSEGDGVWETGWQQRPELRALDRRLQTVGELQRCALSFAFCASMRSRAACQSASLHSRSS